MEIFEKNMLMDGAAMNRSLTRIAHEIIEKNKGIKKSRKSKVRRSQ